MTLKNETLRQLHELAQTSRVPDFPKPGISFFDIEALTKNPELLKSCIDLIAEEFPRKEVDKIAAFDSRGFLFGVPLALQLGVPLVMIRKPDKLPKDTVSVEYTLEYGSGVLEIHADSVSPGERVLLIDDVLATGGTMAAGADLVLKLGGTVAGCVAIVELLDLNGSKLISSYKQLSLLEILADPKAKLCADTILTHEDKVVVIERLSDPKGLALPGGHHESGERISDTASREASEETGYQVEVQKRLHTYSGPHRDPRGNKSSSVFLAKVVGGSLRNEPGKTIVHELTVSEIQSRLGEFVFDHGQILREAFGW